MNLSNYLKTKYHFKGAINDYLSVSGDRLFYEQEDLTALAQKYGLPLEVAYLELIKKRINDLKLNFASSIKKFNYRGKFNYAYATKANYYSEVVSTALSQINFIETTSSYDLDIIETLEKNKVFDKKKHTIICNGFKFGRYFEKIIELKTKGFKIIPILENTDELAEILDQKLEFEIGLRLKISDMVKVGTNNRLSSKLDSRFGLDLEELDEATDQIIKSKNISLKIIHFHLGGTVSRSIEFARLIGKISKIYFNLKKKISTLDTMDIGGGLPVQYNLDFEFDYQNFSDLIIKQVKKQAKLARMPEPDLIGEYGRYSVNDHRVFIFEVIADKKSSEKGVSWYLVNGSLMNCLPDSWALGQDFMVLPLNGWDRPIKKVKLGGITCDPDDTYYKQSRRNYLYLPEFDEKNKLYIGFFGIGAYQEMISGVGGVHHCLLPEGNELIIYKQNGELKRDLITKLQTSEKVLKILDYDRDHNLTRYL